MTIKTKCVSLEVSQERQSENSPSSYFTTNVMRNKLIQNVQGTKLAPPSGPNGTGAVKIKRKPMISQTMKNSKQGSLNSTPTRPQPIAFRNNDEVHMNSNPLYKGIHDSVRLDVQTQQMAGQGSNNEHILPDSIHNIQFTRNTQANAKTVSNVA